MTGVRRRIAILLVIACAAYLLLNIIDVVRLWLAYRSCESECVFGYRGGPWIVIAILWVLSLLAAAAIGIWLTGRLMRRLPATGDT